MSFVSENVMRGLRIPRVEIVSSGTMDRARERVAERLASAAQIACMRGKVKCQGWEVRT